MQYLGLIFEFLLFALGVYLYLFAIGAISSRNPEATARAEAFRRENYRWLRLGGLALMAIMFINVLLSLKEILGF